jgi:hypothetical protein
LWGEQRLFFFLKGTKMSDNILNSFVSLFTGSSVAHGCHEYAQSKTGEKEKGKSFTVRNCPGVTDYENHINGRKGLGIVPINKNQVRFVVADIDIYPYQQYFMNVLKAIEKYNLPLVAFKSKSGGLHFYLFFREWTTASIAKEILYFYIQLLGIDKIYNSVKKTGIEYFPKQTSVNDNDVGNWINLPYYNSKKTPTPMIEYDKYIDIEEALFKINNNKIATYQDYQYMIEGLSFADAPPCLQTIYYLDSFEPRNTSLFSFAVYFSKKYGEEYNRYLLKLNEKLTEPLASDEIEQTICKSIDKKSYSYKCKESPCINYCNKTVCENRAFGITEGGLVSQLSFGGMKQIKTDPPYYEWEINNNVISFHNEEGFINQLNFRKICVQKLYIMPYRLKDDQWTKIINKALQNIEVVNYEQDEISDGKTLEGYFTEFIMDRQQALTKEDLLFNKVFYCDKKKGYLFFANDFSEFVYNTKRFTAFAKNEVNIRLKSFGVTDDVIRLQDKTKRLKFVPLSFFEAKGYVKKSLSVMDFDIAVDNYGIVDSEEF